jgi:hypothetical protein
MMAKKLTRRDRIVLAGETLYGPRWQSALARAAKVPQSLLAMIAASEREVTDDVYRKVADALISESARVRKSADRIGEIAGAMLADLDGGK